MNIALLFVAIAATDTKQKTAIASQRYVDQYIGGNFSLLRARVKDASFFSGERAKWKTDDNGDSYFCQNTADDCTAYDRILDNGLIYIRGTCGEKAIEGVYATSGPCVIGNNPQPYCMVSPYDDNDKLGVDRLTKTYLKCSAGDGEEPKNLEFAEVVLLEKAEDYNLLTEDAVRWLVDNSGHFAKEKVIVNEDKEEEGLLDDLHVFSAKAAMAKFSGTTHDHAGVYLAKDNLELSDEEKKTTISSVEGIEVPTVGRVQEMLENWAPQTSEGSASGGNIFHVVEEGGEEKEMQKLVVLGEGEKVYTTTKVDSLFKDDNDQEKYALASHAHGEYMTATNVDKATGDPQTVEGLRVPSTKYLGAELANYLPMAKLINSTKAGEDGQVYSAKRADELLLAKADSAHTHGGKYVEVKSVKGYIGGKDHTYVDGDDIDDFLLTENKINNLLEGYASKESAGTLEGRVAALEGISHDGLLSKDNILTDGVSDEGKDQDDKFYSASAANGRFAKVGHDHAGVYPTTANVVSTGENGQDTHPATFDGVQIPTVAKVGAMISSSAGSSTATSHSTAIKADVSGKVVSVSFRIARQDNTYVDDYAFEGVLPPSPIAIRDDCNLIYAYDSSSLLTSFSVGNGIHNIYKIDDDDISIVVY